MKLNLNKNLDNSPNRNKLSVLVITLNEVDNIKALMDNLNFADEIIVIDSFSRDGTIEILRSFKHVRVVQHVFLNFSDQRNFALQQASHDWVLFIDGDERVSLDLRIEILNSLHNPNNIVAFGFYRKFYFENSILNFSGYQTNKVFRLFNKKYAHYDREKLVHEVLIIDGNTKLLNQKLDHFSFKNKEEYKEKLTKYAVLRAKELYVKNLKPNFFHFYIKPLYRFVYQFVIRLGFLDGKNGYKISILNAYGIHQRYVELQKLYDTSR